MRPVYPSSPAATTKKPPKIGIPKYPWHSLEVGQSFLVAPGEANWTTISGSCYKWSKKLGKKFRAINHGDEGIEVARLEIIEEKKSFF